MNFIVFRIQCPINRNVIENRFSQLTNILYSCSVVGGTREELQVAISALSLSPPPVQCAEEERAVNGGTTAAADHTWGTARCPQTPVQ